MMIHEKTSQRLRDKLSDLYGEAHSGALMERLLALIGDVQQPPRSRLPLSEKDVILITYGDQVSASGQPPLATLHHFLKEAVGQQINTVHILPFYPYSSDDGFSVIDYEAVNPELGGWAEIQEMRVDFRLMFDAVFNHISAGSEWFKAFLRDEPPYDKFFTVVDPGTDLSLVRRPRTLPLLTAFETPSGTKHVWTTFSDDQIDLNAANPDVVLELIRILLFYVQQGADLIRLDAIGFLWKTIGTNCIHLPETHLIIQLMRDVLDIVAPNVMLVTETNVPHDENISYFGDGYNEAQMVYQFSLPPLVLHTFHTGDSTALTSWAKTIRRASDQTTFFNFTASHDGIGVQPARGILSEAEIDSLVGLVEAHGGFVSYKNNSDGSRSPYELNINYFDAITNPALTAADPGLALRRFIASQAIMLSFMGVPGIYFHSVFGSRSHHAGVEATGRYRSINRQKFTLGELQAELADKNSLRARIHAAYLKLVEIRTGQPAFHPFGQQTVLEWGAEVFALERRSPDDKQRVLALHSISPDSVTRALPEGNWRDLINGSDHHDSITLEPYQVAWLATGEV